MTAIDCKISDDDDGGLHPLEAIARAIDSLATEASAGLDDSELSRRLLGLVRLREQLTSVTGGVGREWSQRRIWAADGSRSAGHRLARDANLSISAAKQLLRAGAAAAVMPHVAAAWAAGTISLHHVSLLADARHSREPLFERDEAMLVTQAATLRFDETRKVVAYWTLRADALLNPDGPPPICHSCATIATTYGGVVHLDATLDPVGGAEFTQALNRIENELRLADQRDGRLRTLGERNADALVELARRAFTAPADGRRPEPLLVIAAGAERFAQLCELSTGAVVHPTLLVPHLSRLQVQTIVYDDANLALTASPQRSFTGLIRRVVQIRDLHCQHPSGCDTPWADCDVDHIVERINHGVTDQTNGRLLCPPHNRHLDLRDASPPATRFGNPADDLTSGYTLTDNAEPDPGG